MFSVRLPTANFQLQTPKTSKDETQKAFEAFDVASGAVPVVMVYDQKGNRVAQVKDAFLYQDGKKVREVAEGQTYSEITKIVEKLVGQ